jgi:hypothetical protein
MSVRYQRSVQTLGVVALGVAVWLLSTEPWGLGVFQLFVFTAPGALLGLGAGWMAHLTSRRTWTWRSSRRSAFVGAIVLPPLLAFFVAVDGNSRPSALLAGFVYAAWIALLGGAAAALFRRNDEHAGRPSA